MGSDQLPTCDAQGQEYPRIETQIHRRKKAKAFSALEHCRSEADRNAYCLSSLRK